MLCLHAALRWRLLQVGKPQGVQRLFLSLSIQKKDRGLRALSRHLPFSPGKYLAQRISFIPWTCLSCWKQLGKGPEKANLAGGGGELQQTGFSTLVDGLNAGCMGPPHPHPQP